MKEIDLNRYSREDLLLSAIRIEIDHYQLYFILSRMVKNAFLREKLDFLAAEETKHKEHFRRIWQELFPDQKLLVPDEQVVSLPRMRLGEEPLALSKVLAMAMEAETALAHFYRQVAGTFAGDRERRALLLYFASMEEGHHKLLEIERENILRLEEYGEETEMVRIGPD